MKDSYDKSDELKIFLSEYINKCSGRAELSLRKLAKKYEEKNNKKISKSTNHCYLKKRMGYSYIKTTIKTHKIIENRSILMSFAFLKVIVRCIKFNFSIIYLDETYIQNNKNVIKFWRKPFDDIYENLPKKERINLILSVYEEGILYYELNNLNTKEENFIKYMKNLFQKIKEKNLKNYVIILDNYSVHKTEALMKLYTENKINMLFNIPYNSKWNSVELSFRNLKRHLYTKIFANLKETINETKTFLESKSFQNGIKGNFLETLEQYYLFYENEKYRNLKALIN